MLYWWCITSAGDITIGAVLNMRNDTFMFGAIKSDEARPGGIDRIYSLYLCNSFPQTSSLLLLFLWFYLHYSTLCCTSNSPLTSLKTQLANLTKHSCLLPDPPLSFSVSQSISPPEIISVSLYPLPVWLSQSFLISVDLVVFNLSPSLLCSFKALIVCDLLCLFFSNHLHHSVSLSLLL